jgi:hypothetical protein
MTLQENYNEFDIDLHDIWWFERSNFDSNKSQLSSDIYATILDKMTSCYLNGSEPFLRRQKENDLQYDYWIEKFAEFEHGLYKDNPLFNDLIYTAWGFYTFDSSVIVKNDNDDFLLWFALAFRHYESKLDKLQGFLVYHLSVHFNSDFIKFKSFLILMIRQYEDELLSKKIVQTTKDWIQDYLPFNEEIDDTRKAIFTPRVNDELTKNHSNNSVLSENLETIVEKRDRFEKKPDPSDSLTSSPIIEASSNNEKAKAPRIEKIKRTIKGPFQSFLFDKKRKDLAAFLNDPIKLSGLKSDLSKKGFISNASNSRQFKKVFLNEKIAPKDRIIWTGSNKELQWFVNYFVHEMAFVENPGNDIWLIAIKCFVNKAGNNYSISQLRDARGNNLKRKGLLYTILNRSFDT